MKFKIWERPVRIAVAASSAILLAKALGLQNPLSAGIVALLSVLETRRETLQVAKSRMLAVVTAFALATLCFWIFGYTVFAFALYLLLFVPITEYFNWGPGLAPSSVLVTHFMVAESTAWSWQLNGVALMGLGALAALLTSLWMPDYAVEIRSLRLCLEQQMRQVLYLLSQYIVDDQAVDLTAIHGRLRVGEKYLEDLRLVSWRDYDNQVVGDLDTYNIDYVVMRQQQYDELAHMVQLVQAMDGRTPQGALLSEFFRRAADEFDESNTGIELLDVLSKLYQHYQTSKLPVTRREFENRAILFQLSSTFETFLQLKRDFYLQAHPDKE